MILSRPDGRECNTKGLFDPARGDPTGMSTNMLLLYIFNAKGCLWSCEQQLVDAPGAPRKLEAVDPFILFFNFRQFLLHVVHLREGPMG